MKKVISINEEELFWYKDEETEELVSLPLYNEKGQITTKVVMTAFRDCVIQ